MYKNTNATNVAEKLDMPPTPKKKPLNDPLSEEEEDAEDYKRGGIP